MRTRAAAPVPFRAPERAPGGVPFPAVAAASRGHQLGSISMQSGPAQPLQAQPIQLVGEEEAVRVRSRYYGRLGIHGGPGVQVRNGIPPHRLPRRRPLLRLIDEEVRRDPVPHLQIFPPERPPVHREIRNYGAIPRLEGNLQERNEPVLRDEEADLEMAPLLGRPRRQPITGQNVADFLTANTPGPITGVSGFSSASSSLLNPPTANVPSGFANSSYVQKLQPLSRPMTGVGTGASLFTGGMDLLSTGLEARQMHQRGWRRFWSGLKASIKKPFGYHEDRSGQEAEDRSASKRLVANSVQNLGDFGFNQVPTAVSSITSLAGGTAAPILGTLASGAGMGINSLVAARSLYRGHRAAEHEGNLERLRGIQDPGMQAVVDHQKGQMNRRKWRSRIGAFGATLGAVGGGLLLGGLLGASMLTPIGWALAAAGGLAAAGLGAYKFARWYQKRKAGTLHTERERHARALHTAANDHRNPGYADALRILNARGITPEQVTGDEGLNLLKRKSESW
jgi:hypothetical protein